EDALALYRLGPESPLVGLPAGQVGDPAYARVHVISVKDAKGVPMRDEPLNAGARIVVRGSEDDIRAFARQNGLIAPNDARTEPLESGLVTREFGVAEVIVAPRSDYIGDRVFPGMVTD